MVIFATGDTFSSITLKRHRPSNIKTELHQLLSNCDEGSAYTLFFAGRSSYVKTSVFLTKLALQVEEGIILASDQHCQNLFELAVTADISRI